MFLPKQSEPVERTIVGQAPANRGNSASGVASAYGVQPSGWFDDIAKVVAPIAGQALQAAGPALLSMI
jgi:hypothetical protein